MEKREIKQNYDVPKMLLGLRIKKAREYRGIPITMFADMLSIDYPSLYRYEKGIIKPNKVMVERIADKLDINLEWLVDPDSGNLFDILEMDQKCNINEVIAKIENTLGNELEHLKKTKYKYKEDDIRNELLQYIFVKSEKIKGDKIAKIYEIAIEDLKKQSHLKNRRLFSQIISSLDVETLEHISKLIMGE